jgi:hypothetical protein
MNKPPNIDRADLDALALYLDPAIDDADRAALRASHAVGALEIHPATAPRRADLLDALRALNLAAHLLRRSSRS